MVAVRLKKLNETLVTIGKDKVNEGIVRANIEKLDLGKLNFVVEILLWWLCCFNKKKSIWYYTYYIINIKRAPCII